MNKLDFKQILRSIGRFIGCFLIYLLIPQLIYCMQKYYIYDFELDPNMGTVIGAICIFLTLLLFYSMTRLVTVFDEPLRETYFEAEERPRTLLQKLVFFLRAPSFWIQTAVFALVHLLLPLNYSNMALFDLVLQGNERTIAKLILLDVLFLVLFLMQLWPRFTAMNHWTENPEISESSGRKGSPEKAFGSELLRITLIYGIGGLVLCNVLPILISIFPVFGELLVTPATVVLLLILIAVPLIYRPIRAIFKRRAFLIKLAQTCGENGISLSEIDRPYRSIFSSTDYESFAIMIGEKRYSCKLIGATKRNAPLKLFSGGRGAIIQRVRFARITLFTRVTQFEFGYEADCDKILIINPVPKMIYRGNRDLLDNGDVVDGYKVYTATGFLGALERGSIDR